MIQRHTAKIVRVCCCFTPQWDSTTELQWRQIWSDSVDYVNADTLCNEATKSLTHSNRTYSSIFLSQWNQGGTKENGLSKRRRKTTNNKVAKGCECTEQFPTTPLCRSTSEIRQVLRTDPIWPTC